MKKNHIVLLIVVFLLLGSWIIIKYRTTQKEVPIESFKQVKYSYSVQNKTNKVLNNKNLWVYAPVKQNSFQSCLNIESDFPYQLVKRGNENQILHFIITDLPPFATRVINIQAKIRYISIPQTKKIIDDKIYLLPEKYVESNHPDIISLANKLKGPTELETAKKIYDWVSSNIEYIGYIKNSRGALYALKYKKGDCTEFMSLFVALCRANNIPSRGVGGYPCFDNCILRPSSYHNWAEFYIDDTWRLADCQKKKFDRDIDKYVAMRVISDDKTNPMKDYSRFRFQGRDFKVKMNR